MRYLIIPLGIAAVLLCPWKQFTWQWFLTLVWFAWFMVNLYFVKKIWLDKITE